MSTPPTQPPVGWRMVEVGEVVPVTGPWKIWRASVGPWTDWDLADDVWARNFLGKPYSDASGNGLVRVAVPGVRDFSHYDEGGIV